VRKTAIVTGGSRGIGYAIVKQLLGEGMNVVVMHAHESAKAKENLDALKGSFINVRGDIANAKDRERCVETALQAYGRVDILINNAGVAPHERVDLLEMTEESFDRVISINLKAAMFMTQLAAKQMISQPQPEDSSGIIINIASISSDTASLSRGEYCVSKAGLSMLTKLFAARLAEERIYVYEIRPGIIETDLTAGVKEKYDALFEQGICPIRRWGQPEDVAKAVSMLCSGYLPYSTGEVINVDGGFHIRRL
jgi:NAD(P)-dependent dehydrogenase (short-subunit alcohol dehydrogenase family)